MRICHTPTCQKPVGENHVLFCSWECMRNCLWDDKGNARMESEKK